jgi:hypothetical protein
MRNTTARGNITVGGNSLVVGGLIGQATKNTGNALQDIADSYYEGGLIRVDGAGAQDCSVGGLFGKTGNYYSLPGPEIVNCWSRAAGITVSKTGTGAINLGGFAGQVYGSRIENCFSASPLTLTESVESAPHVGGFIGDMPTRTGGAN